jgi:hypothetical protein
MKLILSHTPPVTITAVQVPFLKQSVIVLFLFLSPLFTSSQELIKDINRSENVMMNEYKEAVDVNSVLYYASGSELRKTSVTRASSFRIKPFKALCTLTSVVMGTQLYFVQTPAFMAKRFGKPRALPQGTVLAKDILPRPGGGNPSYLRNLTGCFSFLPVMEVKEMNYGNRIERQQGPQLSAI